MDHTRQPEGAASRPAEGDDTDLVFPTVHNIYNGKVNAEDSDESALVTRSPSTKRSKINRLVYAKLHRNSNGNSAIDKLKGKYETAGSKQIERDSLKLGRDAVEQLKTKYSPASFGYPKVISKIPKKVQFSRPEVPVPKPRASLINKKEDARPEEAPLEAIVVEQVQVRLVAPEEPTRVYASTSTLNSTIDAIVKDENSNNIEKAADEIDFAEPEDKHFIVRASSSEDSVTRVENTLSEFVMEGKPKEKKRSSSFRRILSGSFFGGKDKKKTGGKSSNSEAGSFNRNSPQRHTIAVKYEGKEKNGANPMETDQREKTAEELFAQMHINRFNDIRNNFARYSTRPNFPAEEYVCMDNHNVYKNQNPRPLYSNSSSVDKYIDTSSSSSTLGSEKHPNTYENSLIAQAEMRQIQQNENLRRTNSFKERPTPTLERFTETPPRAHETYQNLQLVKPKAVIPINSERALPNPYQNEDGVVLRERKQDNVSNNLNRSDSKQYPEKGQPYFDDTYGTVFDSIENRAKLNARSPRSPSLEGSKLRLPSNRERVELQPRIKSPIPQTKISTEKIIATELLKAVRSPTPPRKVNSSPSHQRLEIQIDYPESREDGPASHSTPKSFNKPPVSPKKEAKYKEVEQQPVVALVHADQMYRASTPVNQRLSSGSVKSSPEKHEIRQQVEAYCWKELKKLKERESYYYQLQTYGYADDGVLLGRQSRSLTPNLQRGGRRSLSLPREVVAPARPVTYTRAQPIPEGRTLLRPQIYGYSQQFVRNSPERRTISGTPPQQQKPIFNRGSLNNQDFIENPASLKKVSFSSTQKQESCWPTRNGYTQIPPQRRECDEVQLRARNSNVLYGSQPQVKMEEIYIQKTVMNPTEPVYGYRQGEQNEPIYAPKQVRVANKICDNYGQIHDVAPVQKSGVVYGQLQPNPVLRPTNFVRGSRLTASANDMYKRYQNVDPRYRSDVMFDPIYESNNRFAPNRPLPPVPNERSTSFLPRRQQPNDFRARGK